MTRRAWSETRKAHSASLSSGQTVYFRLWPRRVLRSLDACRTAAEQWRVLAWDVSFWLLPMVSYAVFLSGTAERPRIELGRSAWDRKFDFSVRSALPTITGQLLATITGGRNTQLCADCRLPYPVERRRQNGRCPECRPAARSASVKRSKAKRRKRKQHMPRSCNDRPSAKRVPVTGMSSSGASTLPAPARPRADRRPAAGVLAMVERNAQTITEGWRALDLFTDRSELCRRFLSYVNDDPTPSSIRVSPWRRGTGSRSSSTFSGRTSASEFGRIIGPIWRPYPMLTLSLRLPRGRTHHPFPSRASTSRS